MSYLYLVLLLANFSESCCNSECKSITTQPRIKVPPKAKTTTATFSTLKREQGSAPELDADECIPSLRDFLWHKYLHIKLWWVSQLNGCYCNYLFVRIFLLISTAGCGARENCISLALSESLLAFRSCMASCLLFITLLFILAEKD